MLASLPMDCALAAQLLEPVEGRLQLCEELATPTCARHLYGDAEKMLARAACLAEEALLRWGSARRLHGPALAAWVSARPACLAGEASPRRAANRRACRQSLAARVCLREEWRASVGARGSSAALTRCRSQDQGLGYRGGGSVASPRPGLSVSCTAPTSLPVSVTAHALPLALAHCRVSLLGPVGVAGQLQRIHLLLRRQGLYLVALVVGMVGVTYASVPLYRYALDPPLTCATPVVCIACHTGVRPPCRPLHNQHIMEAFLAISHAEYPCA